WQRVGAADQHFRFHPIIGKQSCAAGMTQGNGVARLYAKIMRRSLRKQQPRLFTGIHTTGNGGTPESTLRIDKLQHGFNGCSGMDEIATYLESGFSRSDNRRLAYIRYNRGLCRVKRIQL